MGFSRQEYWSGLPCPPPEDLPDPGIKASFPSLQADSLPSEPPGKPVDTQVVNSIRAGIVWEVFMDNSFLKKNIYLAALGLSCVMQSSLHHAGSFVVAHGLSGCGTWAQKL